MTGIPWYALLLVLGFCTLSYGHEAKQSKVHSASDTASDLYHRIKRHVSSNPNSLLPVVRTNQKADDDLEGLKRRKRTAEIDVAPSVNADHDVEVVQKIKNVKRRAQEEVQMLQDPARRTKRQSESSRRKRRHT